MLTFQKTDALYAYYLLISLELSETDHELGIRIRSEDTSGLRVDFV